MAESDETAGAIVAGQTSSLEVVKMALSNVCFGSKADVTLLNFDVRFTPESGHGSAVIACPLWAMCGRLRVGKDFLHERSIGRCSHVFGLLMRFT